jgi:cytochrome c-type biogenesis protein CcmH/NrfG
MRLGEALFAMDRLKGAEAAFRAAGELMPDNAVVHNDLAVLYWDIAQQTQEVPYAQQALVHMERALSLDPTNADVLVNVQAMTSALEV